MRTIRRFRDMERMRDIDLRDALGRRFFNYRP
jgi:hypothetical protein